MILRRATREKQSWVQYHIRALFQTVYYLDFLHRRSTVANKIAKKFVQNKTFNYSDKDAQYLLKTIGVDTIFTNIRGPI